MRPLKPLFAKTIIFLVLALLFLVLAGGCAAKGQSSQTAKKTEEVKYAQGFQIEYLNNGCKRLFDGEGRELLLVPRGQKPPADSENALKIEIPVKKVVVCSTTQAALLKPLGVLNSIVGVTTEEKNWFIDPVKKAMAKGEIVYLGKNTAMDYEKLRALRPDVVFIYTKTPGMSEVLQKLNELGIPVAVDNEYLEEHPLARMEWVKFLAAFYDKEKEADNFFNQAVKRAQEVEEKTAGAKGKPKVLWGSISQGKVYVPRAGSYVAKMIAMAGGDYLFNDLAGTGSASITLEEFYARGQQADVYISSTSPNYGVTSIQKIIAQGEILSGLKAVKEEKVWCFQPWYWQTLDQTDEQIEDLAAIFHPELYPDYKLKHFLKLPAK